MKTPIVKKDYLKNLPPAPTGFEIIYQRWLSKHNLNKKVYHANCSQLTKTYDEYACCDYTMVSADTKNVLVEYKSRKDTNVYQYAYTFIEKQKLESNLTVCNLLKSKFLYVVDWSDCVTCWFIDSNHQLEPDVMPMPESEFSITKVLKPIFKLDYDRADLVFAKRKGTVATKQELVDYIKRKTTDYGLN